jgi:putative Mg2+ transporter-C (MgtC) family protein
MRHELFGPLELEFCVNIVLSVAAGYVVGIEREMKGKDAGVNTHIYVVAGSMLFTFLSMLVDPASKSRIAAQIVTGIGFLGAGLIIKEGLTVKNLTTAASIWYASAIGMAIGYGFYVVAILAALSAVVIPFIPHPRLKRKSSQHE